jgi:hypothetical protein
MSAEIVTEAEEILKKPAEELSSGLAKSLSHSDVFSS